MNDNQVRSRSGTYETCFGIWCCWSSWTKWVLHGSSVHGARGTYRAPSVFWTICSLRFLALSYAVPYNMLTIVRPISHAFHWLHRQKGLSLYVHVHVGTHAHGKPLVIQPFILFWCLSYWKSGQEGIWFLHIDQQLNLCNGLKNIQTWISLHRYISL